MQIKVYQFNMIHILLRRKNNLPSIFKPIEIHIFRDNVN